MDILKRYYRMFFPIWEGCEAGAYLGSGSYGDVYELSDGGAFKEIAVPAPSSAGFEEAFFQGLTAQGAKVYFEEMKQKALDEAAILMRLASCPEILNVKDCVTREFCPESGAFGWVIFVRMERLEPLKRHILRDGITVRETAKLAADLCAALIACRAAGILHRDIKPENVLYDPAAGRFKLGDFGVACCMERGTEQKGLAGTLTHMAPEIYHGARFDFEADLYAVGMVMYRILNENRIPFLPDFPADFTMEMRNKAQLHRLSGEGEIPLPSFARRENDADCQMLRFGDTTRESRMALAEIAAKAIAAKREDRYPSPAVLRQALCKWMELSQ